MKKIRDIGADFGKFFCKWFHWHSPTIIKIGGVNTKSKCKYCGREIMLDSQGNWFTYMEDTNEKNRRRSSKIK